MCGIFGIIGKQQDIKPATTSLAHRGPDSSGYYIDDLVSLGFRRLSIIDLSSNGDQPMCNEDKTIWIIFNGEIYNYKELKDQLKDKHVFKSKTDTETLIHGYEEWGMNGLLKKVNGMFAFAIYDKKQKRLILARDRIGKKPIYYYNGTDFLAFSSETKGFFNLTGFSFDIDQEIFKKFLGFPFVLDNEKTILKNVQKVPPASYVEIDAKLLPTVKKYWDFLEIMNHNYPENFIKNPQAELEDLLTDSVKKRLEADVPVGILLSGGLDSSLITALASKNKKDPIKTINISFEKSVINESNFAEIVAKHCNTDHISIKLQLENTYEDFKRNIWIYDSLDTIDGGLYSTYLMSKTIRDLGVKVVLVGEGADEIFGGYSWFQLSLFPFNLLPGVLKSSLYYYAIMRSFQNKNYPIFLNKKLNECSNHDYFKKVQYFEVAYSLPNHYCMKVDKGTSAGSVEARAPYIDYRIVDFASKLTKGYFLSSKVLNLKMPIEKSILRNIAKKYLPPEIVTRKKKGGMLPTNEILNIGVIKDREIILKNNYLKSFYPSDYLSKLIDNPDGNIFYKWQREWILWKCLIFSLWFEYYAKLK